MSVVTDPVVLSIIGKAIGFIFLAGVVVALLIVYVLYRVMNR